MIYIGADHRGFNLKEKIKEWLSEWGFDFVDAGNSVYDKDDDYPLIAFKLVEKTVADKGKGILVCGSGVGVAVAANKVTGARAGLCFSEKQTRDARNDDDMNVLCLSSEIVEEELNRAIVKTFLETHFGSEEKYIRRINQINNYELEKRQ